ncbi:hypothetical protein KC19_VG209500 [Ceratodon purpureus]|uniref:Uncharacterized protein n=1 Tax=Ceratodon purpureus TaxID=3225 RepID=A0A8T0HSA1_CERPU|nr:hypothetical protein KC19_VG209500 [Ceratodon purpureus]
MSLKGKPLILICIEQISAILIKSQFLTKLKGKPSILICIEPISAILIQFQQSNFNLSPNRKVRLRLLPLLDPKSL